MRISSGSKVLVGVLLLLATGKVEAAQEQPSSIVVPGEVALSSLITIADGHLRQTAHALELLAGTDDARSAQWSRIEGPLKEVEKRTVPAVIWFALPDGTYWTTAQGRVEEKLSGRAYFPRLLEGRTVIGELVVSTSTGRSVAIVAVPVKNEDGEVVGILGSSIHLDRLSEQIRQEMGLTEREIFYAFDEEPLLALVWDPDLIFIDPLELGEDVARAFGEMLSREQGVVTYTFRGRERTVLFRRSELTGWRYAFGEVRQ